MPPRKDHGENVRHYRERDSIHTLCGEYIPLDRHIDPGWPDCHLCRKDMVKTWDRETADRVRKRTTREIVLSQTEQPEPEVQGPTRKPTIWEVDDASSATG